MTAILHICGIAVIMKSRADAVIQLEANVALKCQDVAMSTGAFARQLGQPPRIVRIMSPDWALANKLAAKRTMTRGELALELRTETRTLTQDRLISELGGAIPDEEMAGLAMRIKAAINRLAEWLEG